MVVGCDLIVRKFIDYDALLICQTFFAFWNAEFFRADKTAIAAQGSIFNVRIASHCKHLGSIGTIYWRRDNQGNLLNISIVFKTDIDVAFFVPCSSRL